MSEPHPDRKSYESIWDKLIWEEICNYKKEYLECIEVLPNAQEEIWNAYIWQNNYAKNNYMKSHEGLLDRHKVAACYMIAILKVRPLRIVQSFNNEILPLAVNEMLAITIGLSLVRTFAISAINNNKDYSEEQKKDLIAQFVDGIIVPDAKFVNHGVYIDNFANELFIVSSEGKLNILTLAHELYLLEVITRLNTTIEM